MKIFLVFLFLLAISFFLILIAVFIIFPKKKKLNYTGFCLLYKKIEKYFIFIQILLYSTITFLTYNLIAILFAQVMKDDSHFIYLWPINGNLIIPSLLLSILLTIVYWNSFLKLSFFNYRAYFNQKIGGGGWILRIDTLARVVSISMFIFGCIIFFLYCDTYIYFKEKSIIVNRFFSLNEKVFNYNDIKKLYIIKKRIGRKNKLIDDEWYRIILKNGDVISVLDFPMLNYNDVEKTVKFISDKSGIPIEYRLKMAKE